MRQVAIRSLALAGMHFLLILILFCGHYYYETTIVGSTSRALLTALLAPLFLAKLWFGPKFPAGVAALVLYLLNSCLYGTALALLWRAIRPHKSPEGHCLQCGYDLRGSLAAGQTSCPECGAEAAGSGVG